MVFGQFYCLSRKHCSHAVRLLILILWKKCCVWSNASNFFYKHIQYFKIMRKDDRIQLCIPSLCHAVNKPLRLDYIIILVNMKEHVHVTADTHTLSRESPSLSFVILFLILLTSLSAMFSCAINRLPALQT